ncbi:HK97 gp10 family phage protein [Massilioclostridium coli]|uniref:HK97 gp10 family phage protein n=1 Tax=Massilioclostridium coli TaxID=1870991 RepID=UPI00085C141C|nr:HK97 gp10 family phage protein [Massilioclostridium coli]
MAGVKISIDGIPELERELQRLNGIRFDAVTKKQTTQMLNRARQSGGTPVDTGELRASSSTTNDEIGYTKEYAPHVEYGHRTVNGGWVPGQRFLKANVDTQAFIYYQDLLKAIRKG